MTLVSCLAPPLEPLYRAVSAHLGVSFENGIPWPECEEALYAGRVQLGFLCGLAYVRQRNWESAPLELLGAPVFGSPRYRDRPIYFSDVVVAASSPYGSLEELRGRRFVYNEPNSQSGCNAMRHRIGHDPGFFGQELRSGSHQASLRWLVEGKADVAAVDTTLLEALQPGGLRVLETLGPYPIQPLLIHTSVPPARRAALRERLLAFPGWGPVLRFEPMEDGDYDLIRSTMA